MVVQNMQITIFPNKLKLMELKNAKVVITMHQIEENFREHQHIMQNLRQKEVKQVNQAKDQDTKEEMYHLKVKQRTMLIMFPKKFKETVLINVVGSHTL